VAFLLSFRVMQEICLTLKGNNSIELKNKKALCDLRLYYEMKEKLAGRHYV